MEDDPFANQESAFPENINHGVKIGPGAIKSDNQQKQLIFNSHDSCNKLENDIVAILRTILMTTSKIRTTPLNLMETKNGNNQQF